MNEHHVDGKMDKAKGKVNEVVGAATGNRSQEMKGKGQGIRGEARETVGDVKDSLRRDDRA